jgi:hypothetical protein
MTHEEERARFYTERAAKETGLEQSRNVARAAYWTERSLGATRDAATRKASEALGRPVGWLWLESYLIHGVYLAIHDEGPLTRGQLADRFPELEAGILDENIEELTDAGEVAEREGAYVATP